MSRRRRKNKNRKSSDSEDYEQLPFVCRCHRKSFDQKIDVRSKDEQINDHPHSYTYPSEMQSLCQNCEGSRQETEDYRHISENSKTVQSPSTCERLENFVKVTLQETSAMSQEDKNEHAEQADSGGEFIVTSNSLHLNLQINNGSATNNRTCVVITNGNGLKKSRSYHDRQHQESQHNAEQWDFMSNAGSTNDISTPKKQCCDKPFIKLEIKGDGIEVRYQAVSQKITVHIEADKIKEKPEDVFASGFTQTTDYRSTVESCSSYPVSDFSLNERKELCVNHRYPESCADLPPPSEFADEEDGFVTMNTEDDVFLLENSVKETYSISPTSSCSELEPEPRQLNSDLLLGINISKIGENQHSQHLRGWKQSSKQPIKPNKTGINPVPFISNDELKLKPSASSHSNRCDCPLDTKILRRRTFPELYYNPFVRFSHFRKPFLYLDEHSPSLISNSSPPDQKEHIPYINSGQLLTSTQLMDNNSKCQIDKHSDMYSLLALQQLHIERKKTDEEEDVEDLMKHAEEHIEFESGFDEDMLDSDNHTEVHETIEVQNNSFSFQITPPSRSTSREYILLKNSSRVSAEYLHQSDLQTKDISQSNTPEMESTNKKRRGSVVTVVTGDQSDNDPPAVRLQHELLQEFNSAMVHRNSVLTPVSDSEEQDVESKAHSSFEDSNGSLIYKDISSQTSDAFNPFASMEQDFNAADNTCIKEINGNTFTELEESNNTSPRNSSDSAIPGTSFDSVSCQIPSLPKSDSEDNSPKYMEKIEEYLEKTETPIKKATKKDAKLESFNKHLKLPKDLVLKESRSVESPLDEGSDRWAKKRKQFKETRNCNSAGGSSITSNITEESANSEETRSVDLGLRAESKDKGLYTESFHSASWIFIGDDCSPDNSPRCLSKRPRSVAIRERTVRISKGTGDYPWGFRIQFSKPILVTEVDTNGAAEEAGLQVGDIVMTVNGTDVTSIPHSEAACLARQGPDILTLVVGSDISRFPNTPRPTCRGYLHKRTHSGLLKGWRKRWFVLKHDGSLHYYKHKKV